MGEKSGLLPFEKEKVGVLVRVEVETDVKYGCKPEERKPEQLVKYGIVNIDKPSGPTSHQVSAFVQNILGIKKSGHSGTLDPKVTGVLPIALGNGTKIVQALLSAGKEYVCLMHLHSEISEEKIRKVMGKFVGRIRQMPPVKSAVKRQWRFRKVYYIDIMEIDGQDVLFRIGCQAGTYIRKICHDIGIAAGSGAHMQELRRTKAAGFDESTVCTLQDLTDAFHYFKETGNSKALLKFIQPLETGASHLKKVWVFDSCVDALCHGAQLKVRGISKVNTLIQAEDPVAIMTLKDELVALGTAKMISKEMVESENGIAVTLDRVFLERGI